tara:strand:- start:775 stop:1077 length:303 start_codon:yes stop_codon:yes gene_type:complete
LPSPGKKTLKSFRKENEKLSPRAQVFKDILDNAKELKGEIDVTRTVQEIEFEKTIEKEIIKDEQHFTDSRKEYLSNTVQEVNERFNHKKEKLRTRRHSIA